MSAVKITRKGAMTPAMMVATDVPEADYAAWASGTTYALAARCIKGHRIWESAQAGNTNHDPETDPGTWWLDVSATNRWAAFDLTKTVPTRQATAFYYELKLDEISALHIIGLNDVYSVRVRLTDPVAGLVYDSGDSPTGLVMEETSWWCFFYGPRMMLNELHFYGLPLYQDATLRLDFAGGVDMSVLYIIAGMARSFGLGVNYGARIGYESPSSVQPDQWGMPSLKQRPKNKRISFTLIHENGDLDDLVEFLRDSDTNVAMWDVYDGYRATKVIGVLSAADTVLTYPDQSETSIELLGMPENA